MVTTKLLIFAAIFSGAANAQFRPLTSPTPLKLFGVYTTSDSIVVPSGAKRILIKAWGAGGGGGGAGGTSNVGGDGGAGGFATAIVSVTPGMAVDIIMGAGGAKGMRQNNIGFGGAGGGDTYVNVDTTTVINVGSGGGGGGGSDSAAFAPGGGGGNGGSTVAENGLPGAGGTFGGGGATVNPVNATGTHGTATNMAPACPASTTKAQPSAGGSTGSGGLCFQTINGSAFVFAPGTSNGGGRYSIGALSRPSGGGGAAGGWKYGGGGQGTTVTSATAGSGAGGGGGGTLVNSFGFSELTQGINLKSPSGTILPPATNDGNYIVNSGVGGSGTNISGGAGGDGGPSLVVIYFLYN